MVFGSDFENELSFHDLVIKVLENIRSKPHLLKLVLASGGVFLTISQHRYARKIVEDANAGNNKFVSGVGFGFFENNTVLDPINQKPVN